MGYAAGQQVEYSIENGDGSDFVRGVAVVVDTYDGGLNGTIVRLDNGWDAREDEVWPYEESAQDEPSCDAINENLTHISQSVYLHQNKAKQFPSGTWGVVYITPNGRELGNDSGMSQADAEAEAGVANSRFNLMLALEDNSPQAVGKVAQALSLDVGEGYSLEANALGFLMLREPNNGPSAFVEKMNRNEVKFVYGGSSRVLDTVPTSVTQAVREYCYSSGYLHKGAKMAQAWTSVVAVGDSVMALTEEGGEEFFIDATVTAIGTTGGALGYPLYTIKYTESGAEQQMAGFFLRTTDGQFVDDASKVAETAFVGEDYTDPRDFPRRDEGYGTFKGYDFFVGMFDENQGYIGRVFAPDGAALFETSDSFETRVMESVVWAIDDLAAVKTADTIPSEVMSLINKMTQVADFYLDDDDTTFISGDTTVMNLFSEGGIIEESAHSGSTGWVQEIITDPLGYIVAFIEDTESAHDGEVKAYYFAQRADADAVFELATKGRSAAVKTAGKCPKCKKGNLTSGLINGRRISFCGSCGYVKKFKKAEHIASTPAELDAQVKTLQQGLREMTARGETDTEGFAALLEILTYTLHQQSEKSARRVSTELGLGTVIKTSKVDTFNLYHKSSVDTILTVRLDSEIVQTFNEADCLDLQ